MKTSCPSPVIGMTGGPVDLKRHLKGLARNNDSVNLVNHAKICMGPSVRKRETVPITQMSLAFFFLSFRK